MFNDADFCVEESNAEVDKDDEADVDDDDDDDIGVGRISRLGFNGTPRSVEILRWWCCCWRGLNTGSLAVPPTPPLKDRICGKDGVSTMADSAPLTDEGAFGLAKDIAPAEEEVVDEGLTS